MKQILITFTLKSGKTTETSLTIKGKVSDVLQQILNELAQLTGKDDVYAIGNVGMKAQEVAAVKVMDLSLNLGGR